MTARPFAFTLFVAAALSLSCDGRTATDSVRPRTDAPAVEPSVLARLEVVPSAVTMEEGWEVPVNIIPRDQRGFPMFDAGSFGWSSSDTTITRLVSNGIVVGVAPGTADITVSRTLNGVTRSATIRATILRATPVANLVLTADPDVGWLPPVAHLTLGGTVKWSTAGPISWQGVPHRVLYLMSREYRIVDSLDLSTGSATKIFTGAGQYRFCSGACWDRGDFGVIYVR